MREHVICCHLINHLLLLCLIRIRIIQVTHSAHSISMFSICLLDAYTSQHIVYHWDKSGVAFVAGMTLSQFDLTSSPYQNLTLIRKEGKKLACYVINAWNHRDMLSHFACLRKDQFTSGVVFRASSKLQPGTTCRILFDTSVCPLCPDCGPFLGIILDRKQPFCILIIIFLFL